jgi:polysaccharide pyruvyl transferase WcaK-like protein
MDAALVSRFHAMVGALCMHTPVLVLGWSHKYAEVMQQFELEEWVLDYRSHDVAGLVARVRELVAASAALRARIAEHLPQVRDASYRQFAYVLAQLDAMPRSRGASPEAERKS